MSKLGYKVLAASAVIAVFLGIASIGARNVSGRSTVPDQPSLDDATIVAIFDAANTYDIETGILASKKGQDKAVREYGEMLARDHRHVRALGRDLATSLKVTPTPPKDFALAQAHAGALRTLNASSGREFDRAFLQHEVAFHNAVIEAITNTLLPAIRNEQLKDLVTKVAPAFVAHRDKAQSMLDSLK